MCTLGLAGSGGCFWPIWWVVLRLAVAAAAGFGQNRMKVIETTILCFSLFHRKRFGRLFTVIRRPAGTSGPDPYALQVKFDIC